MKELMKNITDKAPSISNFLVISDISRGIEREH